MNIKTVIGIEVHVAVTDTILKLFSRARNVESNEPNKHVDMLDVGMPGALPVLNYDAVLKSVRACLALNASINEEFSFDRKHYFYPDSPQGYQLTQFYKPIGINGYLDIFINGEYKRIRIKQIHMETDAGKSMHIGNKTLLDYNRCGAPLIEIVTEPDFENAEEVVLFLQLLRSTLRYTGVCDCSLELGNFRADISVSVIVDGHQSQRVEVKNLNSYRAIRKVIPFETERQAALLRNSEPMQQECRLFNGSETEFMRFKESAKDYMYFPEPDLPIFRLQEDTVSVQREHLSTLPGNLVKNFMRDFGLSYEDAFRLVEEREIYLFIEVAFEKCTEAVKRSIIKIMRRCVFRKLNEGAQIDIAPEELRAIAACVEKYNLSSLLTEKLFNEVWDGTISAEEFVKREGLDNLVKDDELKIAVESILDDKKAELTRYLNGEIRLKGFFVGEVMRRFANKVDPKQLVETLEKVMEQRRLTQ